MPRLRVFMQGEVYGNELSSRTLYQGAAPNELVIPKRTL